MPSFGFALRYLDHAVNVMGQPGNQGSFVPPLP
jgi:hypothetical protein